MNQTPATLPVPVREIASRLPRFPPSLMLAAALNLGLSELIRSGAFARLTGKLLRLEITDAGLKLSVRFDGRRFAPASEHSPADVTIAASAADFALLALRREDPDTLFFSRRLLIAGDAEAGLVAKNALDSLELPGWLLRLFDPGGFLARLQPPGYRWLFPQGHSGPTDVDPESSIPAGEPARSPGGSRSIARNRGSQVSEASRVREER